jgi:hypothetical protein
VLKVVKEVSAASRLSSWVVVVREEIAKVEVVKKKLVPPALPVVVEEK